MAYSTCTVTGNVQNILGNAVSDCTVRVSVLSPFVYQTSIISGQVASVTTNATGDFSVTVIETASVGQKVTFVFEYYDGVANRKRKQYEVVVPNQTTATFTDLISSTAVPAGATYPAQSVTVSTISGLSATNAQTAFAEHEVKIDTNTSGLATHIANVANPHAVTAAQVGLGNVTNTSDANKPVSTAQQAALDLKANLASPAFTGTVTAPTFAGNLTGNASGTAASFTGSLAGDVTGTQGATAIAASVVTGKALTGFSSGSGTVSATDTILTAVNKLDGNIALKAPIASPTFTGTVTGTFSGNLTGNASGSAASFTGSLVGDVGGTQGATVIGANKVTNAMRAQMAANTIKGNNTAGTANEADLTAAQALAVISPLTTKGDLPTFSTVNTRLPVGTDTFVLTADSSQATGLKWVASSAAAGTNPQTNGFRLTLTSGTPVTTADVTGATTIYCTPFRGNQIALYDGVSTWNARASAEFSLALGTLTSGKPYDVFCYDNAGVPTLEFLVWTNDTTRATALTTQNGVYVKSGATTRRYLGTFYTDSTTTTKDTAQYRYLFNVDNQVRRTLFRRESTVTWSYNLATIRQANASTSNQVEVMNGLDLNSVSVDHTGIYGAGGSGDFISGIGLDSTTAFSSLTISGGGNLNNLTRFASAQFRGSVGVGRHYLAWLEAAVNGGAGTFYGKYTGPTACDSFSGLAGECTL